jgi:hypothetical protein
VTVQGYSLWARAGGSRVFIAFPASACFPETAPSSVVSRW